MRIKITEQGKSRTLEVREFPVTIGRASSNTIVIQDVKGSRWHCRIDREGEKYVLIDLESSNGTQVQGENIIKLPLKNGVVFMIGDAAFRMELPVPVGASVNADDETTPLVSRRVKSAPVQDEAEGALGVVKLLMLLVCGVLLCLSTYFAYGIYQMSMEPDVVEETLIP